uniref:Uncharacterized protein n=2 Tax=Picea TaxID=3328 RepID=A0A101M156_PICGL|nr:hypothetical protein ABT39_MTgene3675 [Picea glauca]QHR91382.1 hypothetical protein Q903MT_gene5416 [Picea sitchensis]
MKFLRFPLTPICECNRGVRFIRLDCFLCMSLCVSMVLSLRAGVRCMISTQLSSGSLSDRRIHNLWLCVSLCLSIKSVVPFRSHACLCT